MQVLRSQAARRLGTSKFDSLYGISSVACALHARKREILKSLHVQQGLDNNKSVSKLVSTCKSLGVPVKFTDKGDLNNLTGNRPHQGIVLETSALTATPLRCLLPWTRHGYGAQHQSPHRENIKLSNTQNKAPFWIALDQVQDPQNLGSIIRTAHFFGVDGLIMCSKNSAPLSPTVSKVSAGAMETMDIYSTLKLDRFLHESRNNGWTVYGASASGSSQVADCEDKPRILVFGNEGEGLRSNILRHCDSLVSIPHAGAVAEDHLGSVDSLNVGVAVGVLVYKMMGK
ncbi:Alpha/beta knot methyltransferase [Gongronella butleri]|nr:Alpha/beta knot methyltransferase [Gongronella butleri]